MATANLGRCRRQDIHYSRARDRVDVQRTVEDTLVDEFEFPIVEPDEDYDPDVLARLMAPDDDGRS